MKKGRLPRGSSWPTDAPFRSALLDALEEMDMARFLRRNPALIDTLLSNVVDTFRGYLEKLEEEEMERPGGREGGDRDADSEDNDKESTESEAAGKGAGEGATGRSGEEEVVDPEQGMSFSSSGAGEQEEERQPKEEAEMMKEIAKEFVDKLKDTWQPSVEAVEAAEEMFGPDMEDKLFEGFDPGDGLWRKSGWTELVKLKEQLAKLKELRDIIRRLGRGTGMGPIQRARAQTQKAKKPLGVVREELNPSEVRSLAKSSDLSRMVPAELQLVAAARQGMVAARRLHMVRRAERQLLSYERSGWIEEEAKTLGRLELRPLADSGPIVLCLDTSGSMAGAREAVAKAVVLEAVRCAHRQKRSCYLYAFGGPDELQEFELSLHPRGIGELVDFLSSSFEGGTSVEEALERSLERVQGAEWETADILLVTDGEMPPPREEVMALLADCSENLGLEVHGILLGDQLSPMREICTANHLHMFKSWSVVRELGLFQ